MKSLKLFFISFIVLVLSFQSCQDNEGILMEEMASTQESIALRVALNSILNYNEASSTKSITSPSFCFDFVYPITLEYNTGLLLEVENFDGLLSILLSESSDLYIVGIAMPFDVLLADSGTETISTEAEFFALLELCDAIEIPYSDTEEPYTCFEFVYPFQVVTIDGTTYTIESDDSFESFLSEHLYDWNLEFVYPFDIINSDGETTNITNEYDFFEILINCETGCDCEDIDSPVCVENEWGIIIFPNVCEAECAGFTEADFVDCETTIECSISDLSVNVSDCDEYGEYAVTIDFEHDSTFADSFEVYDYYSDTIVGIYSTEDLPLTIDNFPISYSGEDGDYLFVTLFNSDAPFEWLCYENTTYFIPDCTL